MALEASIEEAVVVLDAEVRFTPRASVRPEELVALLLPVITSYSIHYTKLYEKS